jgi:hypothetical protein
MCNGGGCVGETAEIAHHVCNGGGHDGETAELAHHVCNGGKRGGETEAIAHHIGGGCGARRRKNEKSVLTKLISLVILKLTILVFKIFRI